MKEKLHLYTIGEVCRVCCVSRSMLRYYDEIGVIRPFRVDEETGYRYYSGETLLELPVLHYLKGLGFSLKEIKQALSRENLDFLESIFIKKIDELEGEMKVYGYKINSIASWVDLIEETKEVMARSQLEIGVKFFPKTEMYSFAASNFPGRRFENLLINTTVCWDIPDSDLFTLGALYLYYPSGDRSNWDDIVLYIKNQTQAILSRDMVTIGGYSAVNCYHRGSFDTIDDTVLKMKEWANEHHFKFRGDLIERSVIDCWSVKNTDWWLMEVFLPIAEE